VTILRRLQSQRGYSLIELLTVLLIFSAVMTGLSALFVQGSNAELDMNKRFEAQQNARLALDRIRRDIHCSQGATTTPATGQAALVTLDLAGYCKTAVGGAQTYISWCTVSVAANRYALYRKVGSTCDATGVKYADYLTEQSIFQRQAPGTTTLGRVRVNFPVDVKVGDAQPTYRLCDQIVQRNTTRLGTAGAALAAC
jgi:prepilin-type N-terminal cleavage/methylation domain-containing protein